MGVKQLDLQTFCKIEFTRPFPKFIQGVKTVGERRHSNGSALPESHSESIYEFLWMSFRVMQLPWSHNESLGNM